MLALLLHLALLAGGPEDPPAPRPSLSVPGLVRWSDETAEIRLEPDRATHLVPQGVQLAARICGDLRNPLTDPGRTVIQVELVVPLTAKKGRVTLLPAGTRLTGKVHLLRGEFRFVDFQSLLLPDGRLIGLPDEAFRLGPGPLLPTRDGTPAVLTVARPLRIEAFGPAR